MSTPPSHRRGGWPTDPQHAHEINDHLHHKKLETEQHHKLPHVPPHLHTGKLWLATALATSVCVACILMALAHLPPTPAYLGGSAAAAGITALLLLSEIFTTGTKKHQLV